jgi:hypothetical protein
LSKKEIRLGEECGQNTAQPRRGSAQALNMNFNATSMSQNWKVEIPGLRRTEASAVAAVAGVIPINFRFVIAHGSSPFRQADTKVGPTPRGANDPWNAIAEGYLQINEDGGRPTVSITGTFSEGRLSKIVHFSQPQSDWPRGGIRTSED